MISLLQKWQWKMFFLMWVTYASFYLCRVNISIAIPGMMEEFGWDKIQVGWILSSLFLFYAVGQFINGQLGDKLNSRVIITMGLLVSAVFNITFGLVGGMLGLLIVLWGVNGYFQSMGWGPTVKAATSWFPCNTRGKVLGWLGTSYIFGGAISWLAAGYIATHYGWQAVFYIPAVVCIVVAVNWYIQARNSPSEVGLEELDGKGCEYIGVGQTLKKTLANPIVWYAAFGLFGLNIVRYGFMSWAPTYMFEVQGATISTAAYKAIAFPVAGGLGAIFAGWLSDKVKIAYVAFVMLSLLAVACYYYPLIPVGNGVASLSVLLLIGFLTFGPHVLIVAALPAALGGKEAASSVTGFINAFGYLGASVTGVGTGYLIETISWDAAFIMWIMGAVFSALMLLRIIGEDRC